MAEESESSTTDFPVRIVIEDQAIGYSIRSVEEFSDFIQAEEQFWQSLRSDETPSQPDRGVIEQLRQVPLGQLQELTNKDTSDAASVRKAISILQRDGYVFADGSIGRKLLENWRAEGLKALLEAISNFTPRRFSRIQRQANQVVPSVVVAAVAAAREMARDEEALEQRRQNLDELVSESLTAKQEIETAHEEATRVASEIERLRSDEEGACQSERAERKKQFSEELESMRERITAMEQDHEVDLRVEKPAMYWEEKTARHMQMATRFGWLFVVILALAGVLFYWFVLPMMLELAGKFTSETPFGMSFLPLTIALVPALAIAWALRHISRVVIQNLSLAEDARLRKMIADTFRSITRGRDVQEAEFALVLQALFRPIDGSQQTEIAPPNLKEILDATK